MKGVHHRIYPVLRLDERQGKNIKEFSIALRWIFGNRASFLWWDAEAPKAVVSYGNVAYFSWIIWEKQMHFTERVIVRTVFAVNGRPLYERAWSSPLRHELQSPLNIWIMYVTKKTDFRIGIDKTRRQGTDYYPFAEQAVEHFRDCRWNGILQPVVFHPLCKKDVGGSPSEYRQLLE